MGHSTTPTYRLEFNDTSGQYNTQAWDSMSYGPPTVTNLQKYMSAYTKSLEPGCVNAHLSDKGVPYPMMARIVHQRSHTTVCVYKCL